MNPELAEELPASPASAPWTLLVVDDDAEVHAVTRLVLRDFRFEERGLRILDADSAAQARSLLASEPDIALILLDVVMETEMAGLDLVRHVRDELKNSAVRIVLRTGQPGQAPPLQVVERYQIDDYRTKTELTYERLHVLVTTALRSYRLMRQIEARNAALAEHAGELERFTYVASHDMQTPLRNIVRLVQLLKRRLAAVLSETESELMELVVSSARDLQSLIEDLLALARLGRTEIRRDLVNLQAVCDQVCTQLRGLLDERQARIEYAELPTVSGNAVLLAQLLRNLIENAIKFQPGTEPQVNIRVDPTEDGWEIRVTDHGIGIAPEHLERIFEPFHRLHTRDQVPGTGVGLAICRRVARLHGGEIRAESIPGQGTTMIVSLPARLPETSSGKTA